MTKNYNFTNYPFLNEYFDGWGISHFILYAVMVYNFPKNWLFIHMIGIIWEFIEILLSYNTFLNSYLLKNPKQHDIYMRLIKHINNFIKFMYMQLVLFKENSNHPKLYPLIKKEFEGATVLRLTTYLNKTLIQLSEIDINNIDSFPNEVRTIYNQNCGGWTDPTFCGIAIKAISNGNRVIDKLYQQIEQKIKNNSPNKLLLLDICDFIIEITSKYIHKSGGKKIKRKRKTKK